MFFSLLIVGSVAFDICRQLTTYDQCIQEKKEYCRWFHHQRYCRQSDDKMLGCDRNLSVKLCMRQISTPISSQVLCVFDTICHEITNLAEHLCSENLNKYGCLGITNKSQFCKWDSGCTSLTTDELSQINTIFPNLELSMSVCPLITGYLIAHSNVIKSSSIDYALLAQSNDDESITTYDEGELQNNYIDDSGQYVWYNANTQSQFTLLSLKINDQSRAGCIGLDISDDEMFQSLFNQQNSLQGVNHVYCQYINMNPYNTQISVFYDNECLILSKEELQSISDIDCKGLGRYSCQLSNLNCEVIKNSTLEYQCQSNDNQEGNLNCEANSGYATAAQCKQSTKECYLDFNGSNGYCSNSCYNLSESDCSSPCVWITEETDFQRCSPPGGCTQQGLSQSYCVGLGLNCIWDNGCKEGDSRLLTCEEANTKYSCSNVQRQDQYCIWSSNQCINILTNPLYSNYYSMATNLIRNKNQCVMQEKSFFRYDSTSKQCIETIITDTTDLTNINRYFCFALKLYTQWDYENQQCIIIQPTNVCDTRLNINPILCTLFENCFYDSINFTCYTTSTTPSCNTAGQSKQECLSNTNELCQWRLGRCEYLTTVDKCSLLIDVTPLACSLISKTKCSYLNGSCTSNIQNKQDCLPYMNQMQCQAQESACYYNQFTCLEQQNYKTSCSGMSLLACVRSQYQGCIYTTECIAYQLNYFTACDENVNQVGCTQRKHDGKINLAHFCQFDNSSYKCLQNSSSISDCGTNLSINIHRCMAFTQSSCYFAHNICKAISNDSDSQALQLHSLLCSQVNLQICYQITTPGQVCVKRQGNGFSVCIEAPSYLWNTKNCSQLTFDGNPNKCTLATDNCYYSNNQCITETNSNVIYDCNSIISKSLCLTQTRGKCVFINKYCQQITDEFTECSLRNQYACELHGNNCVWNNGCQQSSDYCTSDPLDPLVCSNGIENCFSGQNGCQKLLLTNLPCDAGLSESLCLQQNHLCLWIDSKCTYYSTGGCFQMKTLESCLSLQKSCVFSNNQCIEDTQTQDYQLLYNNESYEYCINHEQSVYTPKQQCKQLFSKSDQLDISNSFSMQCTSATTMLQCVQQKTVPCTFKQLSCSTSTLINCVQEEGIYHSPQTCASLPGCGWKTTKIGEGFCYEGTFSCSVITLQTLCLQDHGLKCQFNGSCKEANFTTCDQIKGIKVNYLACRSLAPNCYYDFETSLCKVTQRLAISCNDATNLYDCAFSYQQCLITYTSGQYSSCTASSTFDQNQNQYGCTSLTGNTYQYNLLTYTCTIIDSTQVRDCNSLNFESCINSQQIKCVWIDNQCQLYNNQEVSCNSYNQLSCLHQYHNSCIWSSSCQSSCSSNCLYSQGYCINNQQLWNSLTYQCYTLFDQLIQCDDMGYSKTECLNQNYLSCYWNDGRCTSLIYDMTIDCSNLSETVCENFKCKWETDTCIANIDENQNCNYYTKQSCIEISNNNCIWDTILNACVTPNNLSIFIQKCDTSLSLSLCKLVINDTCMLYDQTCKKWVPRLFGCDYIYNHFGCMYAPMSCQWLNEQCQDINSSAKILCKDIPTSYNKFSCSKFSSDPCAFDDTLQKCNVKVKNSDVTATSLGYELFDNTTCSDETSQIDCEKSYMVECQWKNSACIASSMDVCDQQNILGCVGNQSQCRWRNQRCYSGAGYFPQAIPTLVSKSVCAAQTAFSIKYDSTTYSCILSDPTTDTCTTDGLSSIACYSIQSEQCQFTTQCILFEQIEKDSCDGYQNVNAKVCSQLSLACKYDQSNNSCTDALSTDDCTTEGLSKQACLQITTVPCFWDSYCQTFIPNSMINQCDESTITNSVACQFIDYQEQICTYDPILNYCTPKLNRYSKCATPGLNKYACFATLREPCQFDTSCQIYGVTTDTCYTILNVNEVTCAYQQSYSCAYQSSSFSCTGVSLKVPCDSRGINQLACSLQSTCEWNADTYYCQFYSASLTNCNALDQDYCIGNSNCYYDEDRSTCRIKHCWDLLSQQCNGEINNEECYLDYDNNCQTAKKCEDIIYLSPNQKCSNFFINNASCYQINNYCVSPTAYSQICPQTDCTNTYCTQEYGVCRAYVCSDYSYTDCPTQNCAYIDDQCQAIQFCSDITDSSICNTAQVGNEKCSWQPSAIKVGPYHCTSKPCYLFGSSWHFCQGNEMGGQTCFVTSYAQCESCEQQTDQATCLLYNFCNYTNKQCKSILCQHFVSSDTCTANSRCYWSDEDNVCRKQCTKIVEKYLCDAIDYECHWNSATYQCESGVVYNPDLSITIPDSSTGNHGWLLTLTIAILLI